MKKLFHLLLTLILISSLCPMAVFAESEKVPELKADKLTRLTDNADLLSDSEESELLALLDEISERQQTDVAILTTDAIPDGFDLVAYADDVYDYYGLGIGSNRDGCLLVISMAERDWYISTCGFGITAFTDAGIQFIGDEMKYAGLSDGDYAAAFTRFAKLCDTFITQAKTGEPFDGKNMPTEPVGIGTCIAIAVCLGLLLAFIPVTVMRHKLKSVKFKNQANDYMVRDSLNVTNSRDVFMYSTVTRTAIPKETSVSSSGSSTHTSSSGSTHGGGGGKF